MPLLNLKSGLLGRFVEEGLGALFVGRLREDGFAQLSVYEDLDAKDQQTETQPVQNRFPASQTEHHDRREIKPHVRPGYDLNSSYFHMNNLLS